MIDITHDQAVAILKSVQDTAFIRVEKNAIGASSQPSIADVEDKVNDKYTDYCYFTPISQASEVLQRTVVLNRPEDTGLGFNIIGGEGDTGIFISYISPSSISDECGQLNPGDQILEVNFISRLALLRLSK